MLFKLLIPFILAAVIGVRATPDFHFPNVMLREDIPAGITVHEYNATAAALGAAAAPKRFKSRGLLERRSDCKGARPSCKWYVEGTDCIEAYERYGEEAYYCGYTSRVHDHCTAIFRCYEEYHGCVTGGYLREYFGYIYSIQGCNICGSYDLPDQEGLHNCHVTFNYCKHCFDVD